MTIEYVGDPPSEDGFYLVKEDGELAVAQFHYSITLWEQLGMDYDVWQYAEHPYKIEVIKRLDLEELAYGV